MHKPTMNSQLLDRLKSIECIVFDCDGVLTPGDLFYDETGRRLLRFHSRDGVGIALAARAGLKLGILSGRPVDIAEQRFKEIGITSFVGRCRDKAEGLEAMCRDLGVSAEHTAFVADDIPDLGAFKVAGLKIAVADAAPEIIELADWVTTAKGGDKAAREVCETILKAQSRWLTS